LTGVVGAVGGWCGRREREGRRFRGRSEELLVVVLPIWREVMMRVSGVIVIVVIVIMVVMVVVVWFFLQMVSFFRDAQS